MTTPPTIDSYKIIKELDRGAFGVVYQAHDTQLNRTVALKVLLHPCHIFMKEIRQSEPSEL